MSWGDAPAVWREVADLYGLVLSYHDGLGGERHAPPDTLFAVLRAMGADARSDRDLPGAMEARRRALLTRGVEPVLVAWGGKLDFVPLTLPKRQARGAAECVVRVPEGQQKHVVQLDRCPRENPTRLAGEEFVTLSLPAPTTLPVGYHPLTLTTDAARFESTVLAAPPAAHWPATTGRRSWGCFAPLYALRGPRDWGAGNFSDLSRFAEWVAERGGDLVGTLPLFPTWLSEPCDPSPYAPISRQYWNDFHVDLEAAPEFAACPAAQALVASEQFQREAARLRAGALVDYPAAAALRRAALQAMADHFFAARPAERWAAFEKFLRARPGVEDYARFRATQDRLGANWAAWPARQRDGELRPGDYDEADERRRLLGQWLADEQLGDVVRRAARRGVGLYLDLPLGARGDGYDVWRRRDQYVIGVTAGAPPDVVWTGGQNWGFPPPNPDALRGGAYAHLREVLAAPLRAARYLRIDHVMWLHRLFWIPEGAAPAEGVYVKHRAEELLAVHCIESRLGQVGVVGENLGTVPPELDDSLRRRGIRRMYVAQYAIEGGEQAQRPAEAPVAASLNTHDMPTFAGWWHGRDLRDRLALGLIGEGELERELSRREWLKGLLLRWLADADMAVHARPGSNEFSLAEIHANAQRLLARSPAEIYLLNLEDVWQETEPQNTPGTSHERPNWRRKLAFDWPSVNQHAAARELLAELARLRSK